jgi:DNA invertase Pin-like site-specific DNA recombinase
MNEKIKNNHLTKKAIVYVRQSSVNQVHNNQESTKRQRALKQKIIGFGWHEKDVLVIEDLGVSGTIKTGRTGYQKVLEMVLNNEVGLIISIEMSRLSRDQMEWQNIFRLCCTYNILLADDGHIYDVNDANDRILLGILGSISDFEMSMLKKRMTDSWEAKASRGKLHCVAIPGYVVVEGVMLKDPNKRVQDFYSFLFKEYENHSSVHRLLERLFELNLEMPKSPGSIYRYEVKWVKPTYQRILRALKNPAYAGAYVMGRSKLDIIVGDNGEITRKRKRVTNIDEWRHVIEDKHEAYITWEKFLQNHEKIKSKTRSKNQRAPVARGSGLLAGMLSCGHCGYAMHTSYPAPDRVRYICHKGAAQRAREKGCFSFTATALEKRLSEWVLEAVEPIALESARMIEVNERAQRESAKQIHLNKLSELEYEAGKHAKRYEYCDPENRLVAAQIEKNWNEAMLKVASQKDFIDEFESGNDFDQYSLNKLTELSTMLPQIWHHPSTSFEKKKTIVRTLVDSGVVSVDKEKKQINVQIRWKGGAHSECTLPWKGRTKKTSETAVNLPAIVSRLNYVMDDKKVIQTLNRATIKTYESQNWSLKILQAFKEKHAIEDFNEGQKEVVFQAEAAKILEVSAMSVTKLINQGVLQAEQAYAGLPKLILRSDLTQKLLLEAVSAMKTVKKLPLYDNLDLGFTDY